MTVLCNYRQLHRFICGNFYFFVGILIVYNYNLGNDNVTILIFATSIFGSLLTIATYYSSYTMLPLREKDLIGPVLNKHNFLYAC